GVRGAHPSWPGALAQESGLRARRQGGRGVDASNRLRRADAEHDQPHRGRVRARLLHRAARGRWTRVPRARRSREGELGLDALLGTGQLDTPAGRVVAVVLPGLRARVHRPRARAPARRDRRDLEPAAAGRAAREGQASPSAPVREEGVMTALVDETALVAEAETPRPVLL